jgi:RNA polymerase sigma factor (sigma-70 family)
MADAADQSKVVRVEFDAARPRAGRPGRPGPPRRDSFIEALYRDHWTSLCQRLRRIYGNGPPEPEDLAQIAFAKVIELGDAAKHTHPSGFLFRIAVNAGLDAKRHIKRGRVFLDTQLAVLEGDRLEEITPSDVYEAKESLARLQAALGTLPEKQREILARHRLRGETCAEIAKSNGWSPADVSRQLAAAIAVLQEAVRGKAGPA